jgi:hypothetical protein
MGGFDDQPLGRSTNWITESGYTRMVKTTKFWTTKGSPLKSSKPKSCNQRRSIFGAGKFEVPIFDGWIWLNHHFDCFISPIFTPILGPNISTEPGVSQIHPRIDLLRKDSLCQCAMNPIGWLAKLVNLVESNGWLFWRKAMTSSKIMKTQTRVWVYGFVKYM